MMNQKGHVFLIVLLIATVIGGYLIYSGKINLNKSKPTSVQTIQPVPVDEIANWKTYTNTKYGYSIQYPSSAKAHQDGDLSIAIIKDDYGISLCSSFYTSIIIKDQPVKDNRTADYSNNIDMESFLNTKVGGIVNDTHNFNKPNKRLDDKIVDGKHAFVFESEGQADYYGHTDNKLVNRRLFIDTDKYIYLIGSCLVKGSNEEWNLYNQILSTFKFLDQNQSSDIIKDLIPVFNPDNIKGFQITVQKVIGDYATGGAGISPSGSSWFAKKIDGKWQKIWGGSNWPSCVVMNKYSVPKELYQECSNNY